MKEKWLLNNINFEKIQEKIKNKKDCTKWELKSFLWNYFFYKIQKYNNKVFLE